MTRPDHLRTVGAVVLCAVLIVPGTMVGYLLMWLGGNIIHPDESWLPTIIAKPLFEGFPAFLSGMIASAFAMQLTAWTFARFNFDAVIYAVAALHIAIIGAIWIFLYLLREDQANPSGR